MCHIKDKPAFTVQREDMLFKGGCSEALNSVYNYGLPGSS